MECSGKLLDPGGIAVSVIGVKVFVVQIDAIIPITHHFVYDGLAVSRGQCLIIENRMDSITIITVADGGDDVGAG